MSKPSQRKTQQQQAITNKPKTTTTKTNVAKGTISRTDAKTKTIPASTKTKGNDEKERNTTIPVRSKTELVKSTTTTTTKNALKPKLNSDKIASSRTKVIVKTTVSAATKVSPTPTAASSKSVTSLSRRVAKNQNVSTSSPKVAGQPLRAKHSAETVKLNAAKKIESAKPNAILDTYHNVTVASPPPRRKSIQNEVAEKDEVPKTRKTLSEKTSEEQVFNEKRTRKNSRILEPDEVIVLRRESAKKRIEEQIQTADEEERLASLREPVAFEVNFEQPKAKSRDPSRTRNRTQQEATSDIAGVVNGEDVETNYSDDFESYESDFETGESSNQNDSATTTTASESENEDSNGNSTSEGSNDEKERLSAANGGEDDGTDKDNEMKNTDDALESEEESELTQYPITVIQKDKERKLDSGHYEMNSRKNTKFSENSMASQQQPLDSLDTNSEQLDSGISTYGSASKAGISRKLSGTAYYGGYADFNTKPIITKRGLELMSKIQFDTLTFTLFDMKPISYDVFMQTYGKLNTAQTSMQTQENRMSTDCQTDECDVHSMWTQHPPQYDLQTVQKLVTGLNSGMTTQNCCGEFPEDKLPTTQPNPDKFDASLNALSVLRQKRGNRNIELKGVRKQVDFEKLNSFLLNSSLLISSVLSSTKSAKEKLTSTEESNDLPAISDGFYQLDTKFLTALHVVRVFSNAQHNIIITVHKSLPEADVYRSDFSNLLMIWSTNECNKPIRLLTTWTDVCRAEICNDSSDIIVCGLRDGSIALWDLRETYSYCSKLDGYLTHFAATQSIVPTWAGGTGDKAKKIVDLGAVVDVKSFRISTKTIGLANTFADYKCLQFASLNETGILTVWTLVETPSKQYEITSSISHKSRNSPNVSSKFEYNSPWARVKLVQSSICDVREYLERGVLKTETQFNKTKSLFQKNIYSDEVLRELNEMGSNLRRPNGQSVQGLRFSSIDTGCERIYLCMNRNFILVCSKSLKTERFHKIIINESRFLFPTALRVLSNEDYLAVGLSNGSVMIINCNQQKMLVTDAAGGSNLSTTSDAATFTPSASVLKPDIDLETGKSCAIQNIILNERRSLEEMDMNYNQMYDMQRPTTAACIDLITNQKKPFELRVYDQQVLLSGSALRQHLIQTLELSSNGWRLFALSNGNVRSYDFYLDHELEESSNTTSSRSAIIDITVARSNSREQHLVVLRANNAVEIHLLKQ